MTFLTSIRFTFVICALLCSGASSAFSFSDVKSQAKELSKHSFSPPKEVPESIKGLSYDQHRDIRFNQDKSIWKSSKKHFDVQMLHTGGIFNYGVKINLLDAQGSKTYLYSAADFDFSRVHLASKFDHDPGFAGFKVRYPINNPDTQDEVIVFAGASYFRAVSKGTLYGLSARGLAIDTALPKGEEFPIFREFWIERPSRKTHTIKVFALLDSPSISGAYEFIVYPGETTRTRVKATLFPRTSIKEPGIAPLTSMFFIGENSNRPKEEWRPEIHDSDGLLIHNGTDEKIWRPLVNKKQLRISMFSLTNPKGFGLIQRDRDFRSYQDLETHQELRPSAWITPIGDWGEGQVKLTEIPTNNEYNDNIVSYWVPKTTFEAGQEYTFEYWLDWNQFGAPADELSHIHSTRIASLKDDSHQFIVDFKGESLKNLLAEWPSNQEHIEATISTDDHATLEQFHIAKNPVIGGVRLSFIIKKTDEERTELRAHLWKDGKPLTETWTYLLEN